MSQLDRRQSLKLFLSGLLTTAGTVVLAKTVLPVQAEPSETQEAGTEAENKAQQDSQKNLAQRADRVAEAQGSQPEGEGQELCSFRNSFSNSFKNGGGGGFKNGGFANGGGGGAFKNGGFANGGGGGGAFKNSAFGNGGGGGGFKNGAFANGGFRN